MSLAALARETEQVFARHETFHPRYGWLRKAVEGASTDPELFTKQDATVMLGVGKNMVNAIRYWGQAFKLLEEARNPSRPRLPWLVPSEFGKALFHDEGWDPYVEAPGTLWLLHWKLLTPRSMAPVWWLMFNAFQPMQFTDGTLHRFVFEAVSSMPGWNGIVESSIKKDVDCAIRMYTPRRAGQAVDDLIDCPFRELGLMELVQGESRTFRFVIGPKLNLPDAIVAYAALDFMARNRSNAKTITLARLAQDSGSPGRVFKLTEVDVFESLTRFASTDNRLHVTEQAGVKQLLVDGNPKDISSAVLHNYFRTTTKSTYVMPASLTGDVPIDTNGENSNDEIRLKDLKSTGEMSNKEFESTDHLTGTETVLSEASLRMKAEKMNQHIRIRSHFLRSINLERDADSIVARSYILTSRSVDVIRRIVAAMHDRSFPRAWSITGPYGSGKSSFAQFLDALFGPEGPARASAEAVLASVDLDLLAEVRRGREQLGAAEKGFIRAVVTAQREPAKLTLLRALEVGAQRYWGSEALPLDICRLLEGTDERQSPRQVTEVLMHLADYAPVLLIIDEFGKNLEAFADAGPEADLFVLQDVAEKASGSAALPVFLFTLQHLALTDYSFPIFLRREWSKVQGRFEEIPFLDSPPQAIHVLARAFDRSTASQSFERSVQGWAKRMYQKCQELGLEQAFSECAGLIADCYPLHPVTTLALPELCARYAQNSRTLFSFIASREPGSVATFLEQATMEDGLPTVTLDQVYEYFIGSANNMIGAAGEGSRWLEIERRLRESQGLDREDERCMRIIAVLNLISSGGALRASRAMIEFAFGDDVCNSDKVGAKLTELEARGLITYRRFADEYRIWQGSDFDIPAAVSAARDRIEGEPIATLLERVTPLVPAIAARHSQKKGILRYFVRHFADAASKPLEIPPEADGMILYLLSEEVPAAVLAPSTDGKPIVLVRTPDTGAVKEAALELVALKEVLEDCEALISDWVARREVQERLALAQRRLERVLDEAFHPSRSDVIWTLAGNGERLLLEGSLSRVLSELCDKAYSASPEIRNEMLSRRQLTSQGAKARRDLIEAMVSKPNEERLGLTGYGPEVAMYEAVLLWPGLHGCTQEGTVGFKEPKSDGNLQGVWMMLTDFFNKARKQYVSVSDIYAALMAPPIGLKEGPIPVLLTAALLYWADEVAIYEDGTFQPQLSVAHIERLIKNPDRFTVRAFDFQGARAEVIEAVRDGLGMEVRAGSRCRNSTILSLVVPLMSKIRALPEYTLRTRSLSEVALAVRQALLTSREPDQLLFEDLPAACGLDGFPLGPARATDRSKEFAKRLRQCLAEIEGAYVILLGDVRDALRREFGTPSGVSLREDLRVRAEHLVNQVLNPKLRSFLLVASDQGLADWDWLEAIAMNISGRPSQAWKDEDVANFRNALRDIAGAFARLEALHFERRAQKREGFDARKVTVTAPDGSEVSRVVWIDRALENSLTDIIQQALRQAEVRIGNAGRAGLIAMLAKHLERGEENEATSLYRAEDEQSGWARER